MRLYEILEDVLSTTSEITEEFASIRPPFASPSGKMRMAKGFAKDIPKHRVYVEPFAGSAAVFFAKPKSEIEVLNDLDSDVSGTLRRLSTLTRAEMDELTSMDFTGSESKYRRLHGSRPTSKIGKIYRFIYLARFSMNSQRNLGQFNHFSAVTTPYLARRVPPAVERLRGVRIYSEDYESVCKRYDSPNTFYFLDPPYSGYASLEREVAESKFNEQRFFDMLTNLKGKWLLNYGTKGELPNMLRQAGYKVRTESRASNANIMKHGKSNGAKLTHIIASNY